MANTIQIKRSSTASAMPTAGQLSAGELAINTADSRLYAKNSAGTVVNLPVTSISGQTITPAKVGVNASSPTGTLHVRGTEASPSDSAQQVVAQLLSTRTSTAADGQGWIGRTLMGAQNKTALAGCYHGQVAIGSHSWTSADSQTGAAWADLYVQPAGTAKTYIGVTKFAGALNEWTAGQGILCVDSSTGRVGINTGSPTAQLQVVNGDDYDGTNDVYYSTTSALAGTQQAEILQVISGGYTYNTGNDTFELNEYVNLAHFHCNNGGSRGGFILSNSGTGAWENNALQFFVHGSSYGHGYYAGNTSDAGCAMIMAQGADVAKLQIGTYSDVPVELFANNAVTLRTSSSFTATAGGFVAGALSDVGGYVASGSHQNQFIAPDNVARTPLVVVGGDGGIQLWQDSSASSACFFGLATPGNAADGNYYISMYSSSWQTHFTILNSSGNVGIGTTAPASKLDVNGNSNVTGNLTVSGAGLSTLTNAQKISAVLRRDTTNATANQVLYLDGSSTLLTLSAQTAWMFDVKISAYNSTDNAAAGWTIRGMIRRNNANSTVIVGSNIVENWAETAMTGAAASVVADDTNEALEVRVTGIASKTIRWVAAVEISQASFN